MNELAWGGLLQALFGLAAVVGLILACGWAARRFGLQPARGAAALRVVGSASVGPRERVVVVEVDGMRLVLGVATGQVRALHQMPLEHEGREARSQAGQA